MGTTYTAWLYRKGFTHSDKMNKFLMWLDALGLHDRLKDNGGIFSPTKMNVDCDKLETSKGGDVKLYCDCI